MARAYYATDYWATDYYASDYWGLLFGLGSGNPFFHHYYA
jgi:hypothetical protein